MAEPKLDKIIFAGKWIIISSLILDIDRYFPKQTKIPSTNRHNLNPIRNQNPILHNNNPNIQFLRII